jgi:hypothetical protein
MKILIFISLLFLTVTLNAQMLGVVAAQGGTTTPVDYQNLLEESETIDHSTWGKLNWTITTNVINDIDGNLTMDSIYNVSDGGFLRQLNITCVAETDYEFNFDLLLGDLTYASNMSIYDDTNFATIVGDVSIQTLGNSSTVTRASVPFTTPVGCVLLKITLSTDINGTFYAGRFQVAEPGKDYVTTTDTPVN